MVLATAGAWVAINLIGYAIIVFAAGYFVISAALPASARAQSIVLAPAVGILTISALTAFWVRLGLPLVWATALWLALTVAGALCLWNDRSLGAKSTIAYGGPFVALSVLICAIYFLPGARNDAVVRRDGSFNWIYVDTQYNHSVAVAVKNGDSLPKEPGTATADLLYHFGPYAPAAAISRLDGLDVGDAYARVTRGASLWALMLSSLGLGTLLSLKATGEKFGGFMSVAGLFFYGSLLSLFTDERNSSSQVTGAILLKLPGVEVLGQGGPFSHLILGHSELHGLIAITAIMSLCLIQREQETPFSWRRFVLLTLPALAVAVHSLAALYCLGVVGILLFWGDLAVPRTWISMILMLCLFLGAWHIMGYSHSPDAALATINKGLVSSSSQWWWWGNLAVWFMVGLGFRIVGFRWISQPLKNPLSALVLAGTLALLSFTLLLQFENGQERYGIYFLQAMFSIFAFSRLTFGCWRGVERSRWIAEWLSVAKKGVILILVCMAVISIASYVATRHAGIASYRLEIFEFILLLSFLIWMSEMLKRGRHLGAVPSAILMVVLLVGFLAWITPWLNFGMGRMKMDITLTPGEVKGLKRLGSLAKRDERFATNKHAIDGVTALPNRSYAYGTISERPVLLEGYSYQGVQSLPYFTALLRDNDLMFTATDPEKVRDLAKTWHVQWLVARPETDIALPRPLPAWLVEQPNSGNLRIYQIN